MDRQYRTILTPMTIQTDKKRLDTDYYVEGYAATWDKYLLYEDEDGPVYEQFLPVAFNGCDMSDIIFQYNHAGRVFARTKNRTLIVEPDTYGLFTAADLGSTDGSREMFQDIKAELVTKMSWAFMPDNRTMEYDEKTRTIIHHRINKVFDVSAVSYPANSGTEINARSFCDGVIAERLKESRERKFKIRRIKLLMEVSK
jgi:HK97 family phage prohead protease